MKRVVIIGGGITGLTTAYYLQKMIQKEHLEIILVEQNNYLGGKIHTVQTDEFMMETGADSIVARNEGVLPFISELGLDDQVVYNATGISCIYTNQELHPIPADSVFGIPASVESLFRSTLISKKSKINALKDFITTNKEFSRDSSIGAFLEKFFGKELVEKQIAPVLSGVYSGKLENLTMASTLPYLLDYKENYGSIIQGLAKNKQKFQASANKKFLSFQNGLSTLIDQLERKLDNAVILKGVKTTKIKKKKDRYKISFSDHEPISADFVVLSAPHQAAQSLLKDEELNHDFIQLKNSSLTTVYLGYDVPDEDLPADGTGFIVSETSDLLCDACTWTSRKWPHTSKKHRLLVRLFYKSSNPSYQSLKDLTVEELIMRAQMDIKKALSINETPIATEVTKWNELMPNYHLKHSQGVRSLEQKMSSLYPNILLAGASYYGVGIGACIKNGKDTAQKIREKLMNN